VEGMGEARRPVRVRVGVELLGGLGEVRLGLVGQGDRDDKPVDDAWRRVASRYLDRRGLEERLRRAV
jgi:hypothetical protein